MYKTRNYDIKKPIDIRSGKQRDLSKNINIPLTSSIQTKKAKNNITLSAAKPRQMSLSLGTCLLYTSPSPRD